MVPRPLATTGRVVTAAPLTAAVVSIAVVAAALDTSRLADHMVEAASRAVAPQVTGRLVVPTVEVAGTGEEAALCAAATRLREEVGPILRVVTVTAASPTQ
jgi:hypothetical protein